MSILSLDTKVSGYTFKCKLVLNTTSWGVKKTQTMFALFWAELLNFFLIALNFMLKNLKEDEEKPVHKRFIR